MNTLLENSAQCKVRPYYESEEKADAYEVRVQMPGVKKDGVSLSLNGDELSIQGKRAAVPEGWRAVSRESADADYELALGLNVEIDGEKIAAKVEDGILTLTLPKAERAKPRQISIE
jgi:HSP20 family protein